MTTEPMTEKDELLTRLSHDLVKLIDTEVAALPVSTQNEIADALHSEGGLTVFVEMNPWPTFIIALMTGPDADPVELSRCSPSSGSLQTKDATIH